MNAHFKGHVVTAGGQEFALRVPLDGVHLVGVSLQQSQYLVPLSVQDGLCQQILYALNTLLRRPDVNIL